MATVSSTQFEISQLLKEDLDNVRSHSVIHRQAEISVYAEWGQYINEVFQWLADKASAG